MADLYETYQGLFRGLEKREQLARRTQSQFRAQAADPARIDALRALKDRLQATAAVIEAAVFELQNSGRTEPELSHALSIANHCAAGAAQLLVAALDGSEQIRAAIADMQASCDALDAIETGTQALLDDLDHTTAVLTTAGKVLELIKP